MSGLAVIADDLTGANDTGVQFRKFGLHTMVLIDLPQRNAIPQDIDVVVVDTDSRAVPGTVAAAKVAQVCRMMRDLGIHHIYKKIDSTLRGNLRAEIAAACKELKPAITIIAPAYPKTGRVTVGGYQLLGGIPISLTEIAHDPKTPVTEAWLPNLLGSEESPRIGTVPLETVMGGKEAIQAELEKQLTLDKDWIVLDAVSETNLLHIVEASLPFERVLWVGSAGLAEQIPVALRWGSDHSMPAAPLHSSVVLVVAGSVSAVTQNQIRAYVAKTAAANIVVDSVAAVLAPLGEVERIVAEAAPMLEQRTVVISCSNERQVIEQAVAAGESIGILAGEVSARIASVLGLAAAGMAKLGVNGLFLTGGETAISACRALGAAGIEILAEVVPGIPLGRLNGGSCHGLPVVTKAGTFGGEDAIIEAINALKEKER